MAELIEGVDYHLYYLDFANRANPALTVLNDDGTADIYLNTLFSRERLAQELEHELRHLKDQHFYAEGVSIERAERQADGESVDLITAARERGNIVEFHSQAALAGHIKTLAQQRQIDLQSVGVPEWVQVPASGKKRTAGRRKG